MSDSTDAPRPAVILLSGGLDSATVLALAQRDGYACHALSFDYGQRHRFELDAAAAVANAHGAVEHRVATIDLRAFGGSALTTDGIEVPKGRTEAAMADSIPVTYVPARNTIFLSFALGYAEVIGARDLFIGVSAIDYSGYPDCRPAFIDAFERLANLATRIGVEEGGLRVHAPLIDRTKADTIALGLELGVDYGMTHSCYDPGPDGAACGACDACLLRAAGFEAAGAPDPTRYRNSR